ncbi:hypothetical protein MYOV003v1_p0006 [Vibrio phage 207E48.1]|nr:hypothetical protein MYOV003v1_p0006 [Vibrio phage 207E48.1]
MKVSFTPIATLSEFIPLNGENAVEFVNAMKGTTWREVNKDGDIIGYLMRMRADGDYCYMNNQGEFEKMGLGDLMKLLKRLEANVRRNVTRLACTLNQKPQEVALGRLLANTCFSFDDDRITYVTIDSGDDNSPTRLCIALGDMSQQCILKTKHVTPLDPTGMSFTFDRK